MKTKTGAIIATLITWIAVLALVIATALYDIYIVGADGFLGGPDSTYPYLGVFLLELIAGAIVGWLFGEAIVLIDQHIAAKWYVTLIILGCLAFMLLIVVLPNVGIDYLIAGKDIIDEARSNSSIINTLVVFRVIAIIIAGCMIIPVLCGTWEVVHASKYLRKNEN